MILGGQLELLNSLCVVGPNLLWHNIIDMLDVFVNFVKRSVSSSHLTRLVREFSQISYVLSRTVVNDRSHS